jgi:hypothetical protein
VSFSIAAGLLLATICAIATNVGALLKHRGANAVPAFETRRPLRSTRALMGSGWFALGLALAQFAGVLHIAALALAPMSIVQVVVATGVVLLAVLAERILGCTVPRKQRIGLMLGAAGLALLVLTLPRLHGPHGRFGIDTMAAFEALTAVVAVALAASPRLPRLTVHRGVLLGAAAGGFFGLSDVAVKAITGAVENGAGAFHIAPWLAVALCGGVAAQILAVRGLQEGEAVPVIALTGVAANLANIAGGVIVFSDPLAHSPFGFVAQTLAFGLVIVGAALVPNAPTKAPSGSPLGAALV